MGGGLRSRALPAADAARRSRGKHSDRILWMKQGAVFGAALRFLQAPSAVRRKNRLSARGMRSAFCKRAPPRAAKTGHRNPEGLDHKSNHQALTQPGGLDKNKIYQSSPKEPQNEKPPQPDGRRSCFCLVSPPQAGGLDFVIVQKGLEFQDARDGLGVLDLP